MQKNDLTSKQAYLKYKESQLNEEIIKNRIKKLERSRERNLKVTKILESKKTKIIECRKFKYKQKSLYEEKLKDEKKMIENFKSKIYQNRPQTQNKYESYQDSKNIDDHNKSISNVDIKSIKNNIQHKRLKFENKIRGQSFMKW